jgi:hypothetical protein
MWWSFSATADLAEFTRSCFFSDWGLITVRVHDVPLAQVIKSIERQGWVTLYTNIDPATPISMDVIKVPLPEAMETLAVNIPPDNSGAGGAPAGGNGEVGRPGRGGPRGFGGAQWKLGFFAAPTSAQVKQEIYNFQSGAAPDDNTKIYSYPTSLQMLATDSEMPVADPRLQVWPGLPAAPPAPANPDGQPHAPPAPPATVQDYLDVLAQSADIWIMSPASWNPAVSGAPADGSSIIGAVKSMVGRGHGAVTQAIVLYTRPRRAPGDGTPRRVGFVNADTGWFSGDDRIRNAINGLPPAARPAALDQLKQETAFRQQLRAAPADQRRAMLRQRFMNRAGAMDNWRRSPERRAQMYQRAVSNRVAARGQ